MSIEREIALIEKCKGGDKDAFALLIKFYKDKVFGYLFKICRDKDLAMDLFQDVLLKSWNGLKRYDEQNKFASWLFAIAHNTAMDSVRKNRFKLVELSETEIGTNTNSENPYNRVELDETKEIVNRIVNKLSHKQRQVFLLRTDGELTFKEISDLMKEPLNTVLSHMHYAVKKLRKELKAHYE